MVVEKGLMAANVAGCSHFFSEFLIFAAKTFILWFIAYLIDEMHMQIYTLVIFLLYIALLYFNYQELTSSAFNQSNLKSAQAEENIFEIIHIQPKVEKCNSAENEQKDSGH